MSFIKNSSSVLQYFIKKTARSGKDGKIFFEDEKIFRIEKKVCQLFMGLQRIITLWIVGSESF
jgi:hypothetical protein